MKRRGGEGLEGVKGINGIEGRKGKVHGSKTFTRNP